MTLTHQRTRRWVDLFTQAGSVQFVCSEQTFNIRPLTAVKDLRDKTFSAKHSN